MTNTIIFANLITRYNELSYTHDYIYGFVKNGAIWAVFTNSDVMPYVCKLDKASRGAGYSLRFCPNNEQKAYLMAQDARVICSAEYFEELVKNSKYNKGEIFEKLITEKFTDETWKKDTVKFTDGGDVTIDNTPYQVKFEKATFTNEKTLAKL